MLAFTGSCTHTRAHTHTHRHTRTLPPHYIKSLNYGLPISSQCTVCPFFLLSWMSWAECVSTSKTTPRDAPNPAGPSEKINTAIITEERDMGHVWHDKPQMDISGWPSMCLCASVSEWVCVCMCVCVCVCVCVCDSHVCVYVCTPFCVSEWVHVCVCGSHVCVYVCAPFCVSRCVCVWVETWPESHVYMGPCSAVCSAGGVRDGEDETKRTKQRKEKEESGTESLK